MDYLLENIRPTISFCIPTYNRREKIYKLVLEILKYKDNDIEVVVLDNNSNDGTEQQLLNINDKRFKYYKNNTNLGGIYNFIKVMDMGIGEFIVFCTDKDTIQYKNIYKLVDFFKNNKEIIVGYCELNICREAENSIYDKGINSLNKIAYLSKHPTGYFYKNNYLKNLNIVNRFSDINIVGAFPFEFICAELSILGKSAIIKLPLFFTESKEEARKYKSHTYLKQNNNIYFTPNGRYITFERYVNSIKNLNIKEKDKTNMVKKVLRRELVNATIGFKKICNNRDICEHHNMDTKKIGIIELINYNIEFCYKFINKCNYKCKLYRSYLSIEVQIHILINGIKSFIRNMN